MTLSSRLGWVLVGASLALVGCSNSSGICDTKVCQAAPDGGASAAVCNPVDGQCYCGVSAVAGNSDAGGPGVICQQGTTCDPLSQTCVSVQCQGVACGDTGTCDPVSGTCKCGGVPCTGGATCDQLSGTCIPKKGLCATKSCAAGLICDDSDGSCKCFTGGPACGNTQVCDLDGGCVDDPCFGVTCTATGAACYGGTCKCGGANGVECSTPGNSCSPIDNSCGPTASCAITPCAQPGTVCNPNDPVGSQCHCGTVTGKLCPKGEYCQIYLVDGGPLAPFQDAGGAAITGVCKGNDPCKGVTCPAFETCDRNHYDSNGVGYCECGGDPNHNVQGAVCTATEACVVAYDGGPSLCLPTCAPITVGAPACQAVQDDAGASIAQGCFFNQIAGVAVCAPSTAADAGVGTSCNLYTDCSVSLSGIGGACLSYIRDAGTVFVPPACLPYCDVFPPGGPTSTPPPDGGTHLCSPGQTCTPLPTGIVAGICEQ